VVGRGARRNLGEEVLDGLREVIPCRDGLQDRRLSPARPSADHCRERIEAGLVYPDDDALCLLCFA
jgi:hypothetical protein